MKTLFITHSYIDKPGGGSYASTAFINAFAQLSEKMTLLYPDRGIKPVSIPSGITALPVSYNKHKVFKLIDLIIGKVHRFFDSAPAYINGDFDTVVFDGSVVAHRLINQARNAGKRVIVIHHNYQYEYLLDNTNAILRLPTLRWCRKYEGESVRKANLNLVLTSQDETLLRKNYGVGNEIFKKIGVFEFSAQSNPDPVKRNNPCPVFIISGSLSSAQSHRSLMPWLDRYYPALKQLYPAHKLIIAGKDPSAKLIRRCADIPEIDIVSNPENMLELVSKANVYICPTSLGGGLKLRIMDGLRCGLPVCTHSVSARGYDELVGNCVFPYSDKEQFKEAIKSACECKLSNAEIYDSYKNIFSYEAGVKRLESILKEESYL